MQLEHTPEREAQVRDFTARFKQFVADSGQAQMEANLFAISLVGATALVAGAILGEKAPVTWDRGQEMLLVGIIKGALKEGTPGFEAAIAMTEALARPARGEA